MPDNPFPACWREQLPAENFSKYAEIIQDMDDFDESMKAQLVNSLKVVEAAFIKELDTDHLSNELISEIDKIVATGFYETLKTPTTQAGKAGLIACVIGVMRTFKRMIEACPRGDRTCWEAAAAFMVLNMTANLGEHGAGGNGTSVSPPGPNPPSDPPGGWPPRPPEWPWPLPWPPTVIYGPGGLTPPPPPPPPPPSGFSADSVLADQTLFQCKEALLADIPAGVCVRITTSENGGGTGDAPGVVDIIKDGQIAGSLNGDGFMTICGPTILKAHLKSGEDECKITVTVI